MRMSRQKAPSVFSANAMPPGVDYWRDSSPLGPGHASRNLRMAVANASQPTFAPPIHNRQSVAGLSMWGVGSNYGDMAMPPPLHPHLTGGSNPFDSPAGMMPPMSMGYPPMPNMYGLPGPPSMGAMSAGHYALPLPQRPSMMPPPPVLSHRASMYSVAASIAARPKGPIPSPSQNSSPSDGEIVTMARKYLASQDLMTLCVSRWED